MSKTVFISAKKNKLNIMLICNFNMKNVLSLVMWHNINMLWPNFTMQEWHSYNVILSIFAFLLVYSVNMTQQ